jgi:hypothetical protein
MKGSVEHCIALPALKAACIPSFHTSPLDVVSKTTSWCSDTKQGVYARKNNGRPNSQDNIFFGFFKKDFWGWVWFGLGVVWGAGEGEGEMEMRRGQNPSEAGWVHQYFLCDKRICQPCVNWMDIPQNNVTRRPLKCDGILNAHKENGLVNSLSLVSRNREARI